MWDKILHQKNKTGIDVIPRGPFRLRRNMSLQSFFRTGGSCA